MTCKSQINLHLLRWLHCPLAPKLQLTCSYDLHEEAREVQRVGQMRCRLCGKVFRTGVFLDQHLDSRHANHTHQVSCSWQWPPGDHWCSWDTVGLSVQAGARGTHQVCAPHFPAERQHFKTPLLQVTTDHHCLQGRHALPAACMQASPPDSLHLLSSVEVLLVQTVGAGLRFRPA